MIDCTQNQLNTNSNKKFHIFEKSLEKSEENVRNRSTSRTNYKLSWRESAWNCSKWDFNANAVANIFFNAEDMFVFESWKEEQQKMKSRTLERKDWFRRRGKNSRLYHQSFDDLRQDWRQQNLCGREEHYKSESIQTKGMSRNETQLWYVYFHTTAILCFSAFTDQSSNSAIKWVILDLIRSLRKRNTRSIASVTRERRVIGLDKSMSSKSRTSQEVFARNA